MDSLSLSISPGCSFACRSWSARRLFALALLLAFAFAPSLLFAAMPPSGTSIGNAASATYIDSSGVTRQSTSNVVTTIVQQVATFTLTDDRTATVAPGGHVYFPHVLTNTGNGPDSYTLSLTQSSADTFDFNNLTIYADLNQDGLPDSNTALSGSIALASGVSYGLVVVGNAPGSVTSGTGTITVTATGASVLNAPTTHANTDTATATSEAVINVTKTISSNGGPTGSVVIYTLTYTNTGNSAASNVTITDAFPGNLAYLGGSARWSVTGSTVLTDANAADSQSGIIYDFGITVAGRVTAVIASVNPGSSGTLLFQALVAAGAPGVISNTAQFSYIPDGNPVGTPNSPRPTNTVPYTVTQTAGVNLGTAATGETVATVATATPGSTVAFTNPVTNTGNGIDSFDITFPAVGAAGNNFPTGTTFILYKSDGNTPLVDTNGNSTPDTGPLASGAIYNVILKATLPTSGAGSGPYSITKTSTSKFDPTVFNTGVDTVTAVTSLTVDLTNNLAVNATGGLEPGEGAGPEGSAVITNTTNPGATTSFTLWAYNPNSVPDTYTLGASTSSSFATTTLPAGWTAVFKDDSGAVITNTGVITPGGTKRFFANVTPPTTAAPGLTDLYFRIISPTTTSSDTIHDVVTVNTVRNIAIAPNNSGQTYPGGSVAYEHTVTNLGNVTEGNNAGSTVNLTLANNLTGQGWTAVTYADSNGNGTLDASDAIITDLNYISNGGAGLIAGESVRIFVKVFAPPGAADLTIDTGTITATTVNGSYSTTASAAVNATDSTTVILGNLTVAKTQVLDPFCSGAPAGYGTAQITTGAVPGTCIKYRIIVTNTGSAAATAVIVYDTTPAFTTYSTTPAATCTGGTVNSTSAPANGSDGNFQFTIGTLAPGATATCTFAVRINQ